MADEKSVLGALVLFGLDRRARDAGAGRWVSLFVDGRRPPVRTASAPPRPVQPAEAPDAGPAREWSALDVAQERSLALRAAAASAGRPAATESPASAPATSPMRGGSAEPASPAPAAGLAATADPAPARAEPAAGWENAADGLERLLAAAVAPGAPELAEARAEAGPLHTTASDDPAPHPGSADAGVGPHTSPASAAPAAPDVPDAPDRAADAEEPPPGRRRRVVMLGGEGDPERTGFEEFLADLGLEAVSYGDALLYAGSATSPVWMYVDQALSTGQAIVVWMKGEAQTAAELPFPATAAPAVPLASPFADDEGGLADEMPAAAPRSDAASSASWSGVAFAGCVALGRQPQRTLLVVPQFSAPPDGVPDRYLLRWDESRDARDLIALRLHSAGCEIRTTAEAPRAPEPSTLAAAVTRAAVALGLAAAGRPMPGTLDEAGGLARAVGWPLDAERRPYSESSGALEGLSDTVAQRFGTAAAAGLRLGVLLAEAGGGRPSGLRHAANAEMVRLVRDLGGGPALTGNLVRLLAKGGAGLWTREVCAAVLERLCEYLAAYGTAEPSLPYLSLFFDRPLPSDEGGVWSALRQLEAQVHLVRPAESAAGATQPARSA